MLSTALLIYAALVVLVANFALFICLARDFDPNWSAIARASVGWPVIVVALTFGTVQLAFDALRGTFKFVRAKLSRK